MLRSHALGTGTSIRDALLGTLAGLLVGGAVIWVIGDHTTLLWFLLPFVAFFVAYAPKAISFLAAQASFSLLLLTLLNIIHPVGWSTIGTVRLEDVAAGFGVSLLAGVLLWPRGAGAVVRAALRADYDASVAYLAGAVELLQHRGTLERGRALHREALEAHDILDTAFRQVLGERRAPTELGLDAFGTLVAGAARIRRTAHALTRAHELWREESPGDVCTTALAARAALDAETTAVSAWHRELAGAFERAAGAPDAQAQDVGLERQVLSWARDPAAVDADGARRRGVGGPAPGGAAPQRAAPGRGGRALGGEGRDRAHVVKDMRMRIDHIILAIGPDLEAEAAAFSARTGLGVLAGGTHPAWGTRNAIVPLGGAYVELVAVAEPEVAAGSAFGRAVAAGAGRLIGWAVEPEDFLAATRRAGVDAVRGARERPDGTLLSWSMAGADEALPRGLPFFLTWDAPEQSPSRAPVEHQGSNPRALPGSSCRRSTASTPGSAPATASTSAPARRAPPSR